MQLTAAEYRQTLAKASTRPAKAPAGTSVPPGAGKAVVGTKALGRDTAKEQPGPKADTPVRWQEAGALFREQHVGMFRLVVVGKLAELPAVVAALETLTPTRP